jgi:ABC-2 type transport system ATP-binding protein
MDAIIEAQGLHKRYGATVAVDDLSFTVTPGRVTGLVGPKGAGKSTTMRMILGLDRPDAGTALVGGRPYHALRTPLRHVGALLDAAAIHPDRRARDHLLWMAHANGVPRRRVGEVIELVGLVAVGARAGGRLSAGQRQRLGIAGALLGDPSVLMFDEPTSDLDAEHRGWLAGLLSSLAAQGRAVLVTGQRMRDLEGVANHLIVIGRGRLVADTSVHDLLAAASCARIAVRTSRRSEVMALLAGAGATVAAIDRETLTVAGLDPGRIAALLTERGLPAPEIVEHHATLDEAYMELTRAAGEPRPPAIQETS